MNTLKTRDILALGFMTFALFVGAGNIIFPPFIGLQAGHNVWLAAAGFLITGVTLPVITIVAMAKVGGSMAKLSQPIGKTAGIILTVVCYLAIGPLFAGPRTATVSFEVGVFPLLKGGAYEQYQQLALFIYSLIYFIAVIFISLHPGKLLDTVGHILAPLKIVALIILGIAAFAYPAGNIAEATQTYQTAAFAQGFVNGYLTMDTLASLAFGIVIINAIQARGVTSDKLLTRYTIYAGLIAGIGLALLYITLFKLGNNSPAIAPDATNGAVVLHAYVDHTFGSFGAIFLGFIIGIACIVTAIGVTTACGAYFSMLLPIPYRAVILGVGTFSFVISNIGLTQLIQVSAPVLVAIYPPCIVLVMMSFFKKFWYFPQYVFSSVVLVSFIFGIVDGLKEANFAVPEWFFHLPLADKSLAWLIPSLIVLVIASIIDQLAKRKAYKVE
ncbi:branched-chain amino acid transport system II carrier protein [Entomomonas asaccharolytica]|uniref:Branched-chain amino acid transport system carrier protein n=1 Tax=Entomomonas asaccharolytica TaxID=2785331 RepID=A0A974RWD2_9GAMM|nr:branched-chain amino acid transport system II carrier protein [Entomomonas asaccharolytica]QQP85116.1 branched-chain amino acid transport system II carrier protein [Entomomonas asaccharolytica]